MKIKLKRFCAVHRTLSRRECKDIADFCLVFSTGY